MLITDGEPSYGTIALQAGGRVVHVQQFHAKSLLGQVNVNKYAKFGPHYLRYVIHTHRKAFKQESSRLHFQWEVKLIKGLVQRGRGRPQKDQGQTPRYCRWRQKRDEYYSPRAGASKWVAAMLAPLAKIFKGKCVTTKWMESKHSQVKRKGASRKQRDVKYGDALFHVCAYLAEHGHLPPVSLGGRPLFKYLVDDHKKSRDGYRFLKDGAIYKQLLLSAYMK